MSISYDVFVEAFLSKITEYDFSSLLDYERNDIVDGYMKRAIVSFNKVCKYDLCTTRDDTIREFTIDITDRDVDELTEIVSTGMIAQWMRPYVFKQENLENVLNTRDFTTYSPSELLFRINETYKSISAEFRNMIREYSYNHGDLTDLHI